MVDGVPVLLVDEAVDVGEAGARAADGQGRQGRGAGHRAGRGVTEPEYLDTLGLWRGGRRPFPSSCPRRSTPRAAPARCWARPTALRSAPWPPSGWAPGASRVRPPLPSSPPTWRCRSGSVTAPTCRASSTTTRWSLRCRPRAAPRRRWRRRRRPSPPAHGWWPSGVTPTVRWPVWPSTPRCHGVRCLRPRVSPGSRSAPRARAALGGAVVALLVALSRSGLVPDRAPSVTAAATALARRRDAFLAPGGPAQELARRVGRTIPLVYGALRGGRRGRPLVEGPGEPQCQGARHSRPPCPR